MDIDYLAVLAAALSAFLVGGVWYSPVLFSKAWQKETGLSDEQIAGANMARTFGLTFILSLIAALVFHLFLGPQIDIATGALYGFAAGAAWIGTSFGTSYLFEQRSFKLFAINAGYHTVQFTVMGAVLGAF